MTPHPSKYDVKTFTNPGGFFKGPSVNSTHRVISNHICSGNNSGPKFLFERNFLVEMKIFKFGRNVFQRFLTLKNSIYMHDIFL